MSVNTVCDTIWDWIREREAIRVRKEDGEPRPWTTDPILRNHHFCNVHREDDRGTKERRAVVRKYIEDPYDLPYVYTLSNLLNYAPSLEVALLEFNWVDILQERMESGNKVFHTAYVITTCGEKIDKLKYVERLADAVKPLSRGMNRASCRSVFDTLSSVNGLGSFLAGQIVADLKNDRFLIGAHDWRMFSVIGPGSKKGLSYVFNKAIMAGQYQQYMGLLESQMPEDIRAMDIHRQDLQNVLCEYSKYYRYKHGLKGRTRIYHYGGPHV